jgi:hypothetical protein
MLDRKKRKGDIAAKLCRLFLRRVKSWSIRRKCWRRNYPNSAKIQARPSPQPARLWQSRSRIKDLRQPRRSSSSAHIERALDAIDRIDGDVCDLLRYQAQPAKLTTPPVEIRRASSGGLRPASNWWPEQAEDRQSVEKNSEGTVIPGVEGSGQATDRRRRTCAAERCRPSLSMIWPTRCIRSCQAHFQKSHLLDEPRV